MCIVDQSIKDGICEGGISDHLKPLIDRQLACHDGRAATLAVIEDLQQVATLCRCQNRQSPIVEDQQFSAFDRLEDTGMPSVASGDSQHLEQARDAVIDDAPIIPASLVPEGASNPAFSQACWPCDQQVFMAVDPATIDQMRHDSCIDAARAAHIDIFNAG